MVESENIFNRMFKFVIAFQSLLFFVFIMENINSLDEIELQLPFGEGTSTVNFYYLIGTILVILAIAILASVSIFGAGLNSTGSSLVGRVLGIITFVIILMFATMYYFNYLGWLGLVVQIFFYLIYGFKLTNIMGGENSD